MEQVIFWILAIGTVASSVAVIVPPMGRNPVHGALSLVVAFFFLAGLYVMLVAHLVAVLQVLIYAGAIVVLFLFVIMLLNIQSEDLGHPRPTISKLIGVIAVGFVSIVLIGFILKDKGMAEPPVGLPSDSTFGTVKTVGNLLYTSYIVPFELTSILLLVAVIGAVIMAKRRL
ncbi:MAG: NADH-quinone oxidoreductase subunit J [Myxococcales bacterium]|nr:NADH-quinone oxidoreductase subunit J [Myxococcales bacterium]